MFDMRPQNCFVAEAFTVKGSYVQTLIDRIYKGSADLLPDRLLFVRYPVLCLPTTNPSDCGMLIDSPLATDSYHDFTDVEVKELIGFAEEDAECEEDDDSITGLSCVVQNEPQNALVDSANCVCSLQTKQCLFSSGASSFSTSHPYVPSFSTPLDTIPRGVLESIGRNANEIVSVEGNEVGSLLHPIEMDVTMPRGWKEIITSDEAVDWIMAARREFDSLMENKTYVLVKPEQAANKNVLTNEWICRKKAGKNGCVVYKARLVVKGYKQVYGVDYFDM